MADNSQLKTRLQLLKEIEDRNRRIEATSKNAAINEELKNRYLEKQQKLQNKLGQQLKEINKARLDGLSNAESSLSSLGSMYDNISKLERQRIKDTTLQGDLTQEQIQAFNEMAAINQKIAQLGRDDIAQRAKLTDEYEQQLENLGDLNEEGQRHLNNLTQQNALAQQHSSLTENQKKLLQKQLDVYDGIKDTIGGILDTAELLTSNLRGGVGLSLIGAGIAGKKLLDTSYQLGGATAGVTMNTTLMGLAFDDAVGTTKALSKEFGGLSEVSAKTQFRTNVLAKNLGISSSEAASLTGNFARLNDGSAETAQNLIQSTKNLAQQNGLVPADVMADVAASAEEFALFGKDGGKNIAEAAVAAGKLGVSMSEISGVANNLLDFENSINTELELGAMLGKNLNLNRARALAFEGEIGSALKETLNQLGGIEAFNKMDPISKKKTADLLGVSVAQFQKMAENSDKLNKDGSIQVSNYEKLTQTAKAFGSQILSGVQGLGGMLMATGQINQGLSGMGDRFNKVKSFFSGKSPIPAGPVKADGTPDMRFKANKTGGMKSLQGNANPARKGGMMDSMSKINMNAVLKGAAAMVIVAGAVFVFGKAVQEFMKVSWEAVGMAVVSMLALVGAVALLGAIMMSGVGAVAILAGAAAMLVIAASVLVLGHALQAIGTGFEMMSTGIGTLLPQLTSVATTIGALVLLVPAITLLGLSLMGLSASLVAFGVAGVLAAPGLMMLSAVGTVTQGLNSLLGGGDEGGSDSDLITEIRGLREDLNNGKVAVYMDGQKVASSLSRVVNKIGSNSYAV
jgi:hypothetical protein